jgi:hypothetical protein
MSIESVDRNDEPIVHDMELLAQYNELQKIDIQNLYAKFIENIHGLFADICDME